ncbi:MAG: sporulation protein [Myxococcaceae bacterium]|jgi:tetratricopeptide (TPR) repeat protein|nr:sporulation protein [Myxococcaceae bacterium]
MGFFDKVKQAVGIGGAKVDVSLNEGAVPLGGFAKGRVLLRGGKSEQQCNALEARLERVTRIRVQGDNGQMQDKDDVEVIQAEKLANYNFTIHEGSESSFDFAFKMPREGGPGTRIRYRIYATADIPGAIDPSKTVDVAVTDSAPATMGIGDVPALLSTAKTLRDQGGDRAVEIESLLKQVLSLEATNAQALRMLAEVVGWRNEAEAVPHWKKYLEVVPSDTEAWEELARNAERRGANQEAVETFDKAISMAPNRSYLHVQRARVLEYMNRFDDALTAWDNAIKGDAQDRSYVVSRARVLVKQGKKAEAEQALLALADEGDRHTLDSILETLAEIGAHQHEDALLARALTVNQDDPFGVHELRAQRYLKRGLYEKAIEAAEAAARGPNQSEWSLSNLMSLKGQALEHLKRTTDAKAAYKKALDLSKDNSDARLRMKAL